MILWEKKHEFFLLLFNINSNIKVIKKNVSQNDNLSLLKYLLEEVFAFIKGYQRGLVG
jgi:hypothetical protein